MSTVLGSLAQVVLQSINVLFVCVRVRLGTARQKQGIELTVITKLKLNQLLNGVPASQDWGKVVVGRCQRQF